MHMRVDKQLLNDLDVCRVIGICVCRYTDTYTYIDMFKHMYIFIYV